MPGCPCLSGLALAECCAPVHADPAAARTAEQLMRSRFTAFALGDEGHLLRTWHRSTRPETVALDPDVRWYRLDVLSRSRGGLVDDEGTVEFRAHHRGPAGRGSLHEVSRFVREQGRWSYVDGVAGAAGPGGPVAPSGSDAPSGWNRSGSR